MEQKQRRQIGDGADQSFASAAPLAARVEAGVTSRAGGVLGAGQGQTSRRARAGTVECDWIRHQFDVRSRHMASGAASSHHSL